MRVFLLYTEGSRWGALWRLLYDSAMRIGEALALTWADVDLAAGTVRISKGVVIASDGSREIAPRTKSPSAPAHLVAGAGHHRGATTPPCPAE